ncbi:MAG: hypothetical protein WD077_11365 [Bacteroidia bacterium]
MMSRIFKLIIILTIIPLISGNYAFTLKNEDSSASASSSDCDKMPEINRQIVSYVSGTIGKKVDRGECWDLAAEALYSVNAKWDGQYRFGREVDPQKECIYSGDIVQFKGVHLTYMEDGMQFEEIMSHHTAIIYKTPSQKEFVLAHQNIAATGRKVGLTDFKLADITKGKIEVFRPTPTK